MAGGVPERTACRAVTIDGPAGTGKSVTAQALARRAGLIYLDSGALYRTIAAAAVERGIEDPSDPRLASLAAELDIRVTATPTTFAVAVGGSDVHGVIRREDVGQAASRFATAPALRDRVGVILRQTAGDRPCVAEGRDMGTTVFPDAAFKIYLTASLAARAERRAAQLRARGEPGVALEDVRQEMAERDFRDRAREASPLRVPPGAIRIDTTELALEQQIELIVELYEGRGRLRGTRFYRAVRGAARGFFLGLLGVRVTGLEHVPPGAYLLAANHRSNLDPPLVACLAPGTPAILAKEELFRNPLLAALIRRLQAIPIRRGQVDRRALRRALGELRHGRPLLVFPEGTRVQGPQLGAPHAGVAWLARQSQLPVVPVRITGGGAGASLLRRRRIRVIVGEAMEYGADEPPGGDREFAVVVMQAIAKLGPAPANANPTLDHA